MSQLSDFAEAAILNLIYRGSGSLPAGPFEIALFTEDPGEGGAGAEISTAVWTNYVRPTVTRALASWSAPSASAGSQLIDNAAIIDFGTAAITGAAPVATHIGVIDESGNLWHYGALAEPKTINNGDPVTFPIGALDLLMA